MMQAHRNGQWKGFFGWINNTSFHQLDQKIFFKLDQGILKGEVSLYCW